MLRLLVARDYRAEGWHSMDLCADELLRAMPLGVECRVVAPAFRRYASRAFASARHARNLDRVINRRVHFVHAVASARELVDAVHVVDHSYGHVLRSTTGSVAGVYCHDLDAIRCLVDPASPRPPLSVRWLARGCLEGLKHASVVFFSTGHVGEQLRDLRLVDESRLVQAPYGVRLEPPTANELHWAQETLPSRYMLHVGSALSRKRLDVLVDVFVSAAGWDPELHLVQVGAEWPSSLLAEVQRRDLSARVMRLSGLTRGALTCVYQRAATVLVPSESEGFGFPVIEALACGVPVVASDIPPLREAGGDAATYCPVGQVHAFSSAVREVLRSGPRRTSLLAQAARFSWERHAAIIVEAYRNLVKTGSPSIGAPCASST